MTLTTHVFIVFNRGLAEVSNLGRRGDRDNYFVLSHTVLFSRVQCIYFVCFVSNVIHFFAGGCMNYPANYFEPRKTHQYLPGDWKSG